MTSDDKAALEQALQGLDYPAPRSKLIDVALINNAPPRVIEILRDLPETADFVNADRLRDTLGVDVPGTQPHGWE
jgi:hypothetical protein